MSLTNLTLEIHIAILAGFCVLLLIIGYLFGKKKMQSKDARIVELEEEMLKAHDEILHFAKTNKQLAETLEKAKIPFPILPSTRIEEEGDEKVRKIPLGKIG
jgi:F0F1-type ATP synthase membrane subunit b/b'